MKKFISYILSALMLMNASCFAAGNNATGKNKDKGIGWGTCAAIFAGVVAPCLGVPLFVYLISNKNNKSNTQTNLEPTHCHDGKAKMREKLKAIHWEENLCWWISSMLYLYYTPEFRNAIKALDIDKLPNNAETVVLKDLKEIFDALDDCQGNVLTIPTDKEREYVNHLNKAGFRDSFDMKEFVFGQYNDGQVLVRDIWLRFYTRLELTKDKPTLSDELRQIITSGHYFVALKHEGRWYAIGRATDDDDAVGAWDNYDDLRRYIPALERKTECTDEFGYAMVIL